MDGLSTGLSEGLQRLGYQFVPFLVAVVVHEFGHGLMANYWGDSTAKDSGRLTLNPIPHIDPIGTLLFPIINMVSGMGILFGWAKPVPIDPRYFRKIRPGLFWVALAGPGMNFIFAWICAFLLTFMVRFMGPDFIFYKEFSAMLEVGVFINYALGIFNLIPLPPLDGSKIIESFLPYRLAQHYEAFAQYSFFILMGLMLTGALSILSKPIMLFGNLTISIMAQIMSISVL
jgi:Zn-dependent protease